MFWGSPQDCISLRDYRHALKEHAPIKTHVDIYESDLKSCSSQISNFVLENMVYMSLVQGDTAAYFAMHVTCKPVNIWKTKPKLKGKAQAHTHSCVYMENVHCCLAVGHSHDQGCTDLQILCVYAHKCM